MGIKVEMTEGEKPSEVAQKPLEEVVQSKPTEEVKYVRLEDLEKVNQAIQNTREYNNRQLAEIKAALADLKPKSPEAKPDELDDIVQKDWKLGVRKVAEQLLSERDQKSQEVTEAQITASLLEQSKSKVMAKHPELSDPESTKTKEFLKVLEENPDFKSNPRGPLLAAYEMEQRINGHGNVDSRETKVDKTTRARATSVPAGTSANQRQGYTLSKSDMDFCRLNGINPENYKRYKGQSEARV